MYYDAWRQERRRQERGCSTFCVGRLPKCRCTHKSACGRAVHLLDNVDGQQAKFNSMVSRRRPPLPAPTGPPPAPPPPPVLTSRARPHPRPRPLPLTAPTPHPPPPPRPPCRRAHAVERSMQLHVLDKGRLPRQVFHTTPYPSPRDRKPSSKRSRGAACLKSDPGGVNARTECRD